MLEIAPCHFLNFVLGKPVYCLLYGSEGVFLEGLFPLVHDTYEPADLSHAEADESKMEETSDRQGDPSPAVERLRENSPTLRRVTSFLLLGIAVPSPFRLNISMPAFSQLMIPQLSFWNTNYFLCRQRTCFEKWIEKRQIQSDAWSNHLQKSLRRVYTAW